MSSARSPHPDDDGSTPPQGWAYGDAPTPPHGAPPSATATGSFVAPGAWTRPSGVPRAADRRDRAQRARPRTPGRPTPPAGFAPPRPDRLAGLRRRLVAVARVFAGGLVVLALAVIVAPLLLGGPGPGTDTVVGHLVAAVVTVAATALAAHRRSRPLLAVLCAAAVPVIVMVVFGLFWWA